MTLPASLEEQAKEIIKIAEASGVQSNFFFLTTFRRYLDLLEHLGELQDQIKSSSATITKEYVKGRENIYSHPAIKEYNSTSQIANGTVATLLKIIRTFNVSDDKEDGDPLLKILNGDDDK